MQKRKNESIDRLIKAVLSLETPEECYNFFDDICTIKEFNEIAQRLDTAILLDEGMSYQKISETLGVSTATISRVNRCLNYGSGGYKTVLDRIGEGEKK